MPSHIKPVRLNGLPDDLRRELTEGRRKRGWSQAELGQRLGFTPIGTISTVAGNGRATARDGIDVLLVTGSSALRRGSGASTSESPT